MRFWNLIGARCAIAAALALATAAHAEEAFHWPNGARAAVSLAYDDAAPSQLDNAIPTLDRYKLHGTFYLALGFPSVGPRMAEWRAAAQHGHELGNHTLFHQCLGGVPGHDWVQPQRDLRTTTAEQMRDQVTVANTMLQALDGRTERTMTVPCGDRMAAGQDYVNLVRDQFVAIKAAEGAVVPSLKTLDLHNVPVIAPTGVTGQQLIAIVKEAGAKGTMANFTFHGIGGDHLAVSKEAHEELVRFLAENRKLYWTDTFLNITKYVKQQEQGPKQAQKN